MANQADLASFKRKRSGVKKRLTDFRNFVDKIYEIYEANQGVERVKLIEIECRLDKVRDLLDDYDQVQSQISEISDEIDDSLFESKYYETIARAKQLLEIHDTKSQPSSGAGGSDKFIAGVASGGDASGTEAVAGKIQLPKIPLPKFSGKYTEWLSFRDTYEAMIHSSIALSDTQKFYYLRAALEGDAKKIISSITMTGSNYQEAWEAVCKRYESKRLLIHNHIRELFELKVINGSVAEQFRNMIDTINNNLHSLSALGQKVEHWDSIVLYIIVNKFDTVTAREWEDEIKTDEIPTVNRMKEFLRKRAEVLEALNFAKLSTETNNYKPRYQRYAKSLITGKGLQCYYCKGPHLIYNCNGFQELDTDNKFKEIRTRKLCTNCLRPGHQPKECNSKGCKLCYKKHNTLLHMGEAQKTQEASSVQGTTDHKQVQVENSTNLFVNKKKSLFKSATNAILSTAQVLVGNKRTVARVVLDTGSQSNFITEKMVKSIGAKIIPTNGKISGLGSRPMNIGGTCKVHLYSKINSFSIELECLVIHKIADHIPELNLDNINMPENVRLADADCNKVGSIDILIGNGVFWNLITEGNLVLDEQVIIQNTVFGWVLAGSLLHPILPTESICAFSKDIDIHKQLVKFWELEEYPDVKFLSDDDKECEAHFTDTHQRDSNGRFIVSIPLKRPIGLLGNSREGALRRFCNLERKLQASPELKEQYVQFMEEYIALGHMSKVDENEDGQLSYYIPHHGVTNTSSKTTRLRVVFDASFPSSTGYSFNSLQHIGPTIQADIFSILLKFRQHAFAISADITKMYRQVLIEPSQRSLQRIFWRSDPTKPVSVYELNTVTYGTGSGAFLAIRAIQQLAKDNMEMFPDAARIILQDFYVDDLLSGNDDPEKAEILCKQIDTILKQGCFILRKWLSNSPNVLRSVTNSDESLNILNLGDNENTKTLGLYWAPKDDVLMYNVNSENSVLLTKRFILSVISQIYDPLGLISPCTIKLKIILQMIWKEAIDWDNEVPNNINLLWKNLYGNLSLLNNIRIPRHVKGVSTVQFQLHGYADASKDAYGACVYIRSQDSDGLIMSRLLCAKSKVAPLKQMTIPRLELCGTLILAKLVKKVLDALTIKFDKIFLWCDSTTALAWLRSEPSALKIFVANRVARVQELTSNATWRYVPSADNPADLVSRGVQPGDLINAKLWWTGPEWLTKEPSEWPKQIELQNEVPELRTRQQNLTLLVTKETLNFPIERFSNINRLLRVVARILRMAHNKKLSAVKGNGPLTTNELNHALERLAKIVQSECYWQEISDLARNGMVRNQSTLVSLAPFLDADGIMRVGGRLQSSNLNYDERHPIILPGKNHLTYLLIHDAHNKLVHAGSNQVISLIRQKFWPIRLQNEVKKFIRNCVACFRMRPRGTIPQMGSLPRDRVVPSYPFEVTGVDYAGPFTIKTRKGRGAKTEKCYIALFVCFSSKAVHLETVPNLTTDAFIAALKRFVARRGRPREIHSDNATNFMGASKELGKLLKFVHNDSNKILDTLATEGIAWHFIPPRSPHFGGLWESAIKSAKGHLKRLLKYETFTFEELYTICCQIESILNCRPLTHISNDPKDPEPLTPGHFLTGKRLTAIAEPDLRQHNPGRLSNYQRLQRLIQEFWSRWSHEYLQTLNPRKKWKTSPPRQLKEDDVVILQEDGLSPQSWPTGIIVHTFPGTDNSVRAVNVKTAKGVFKRPATKVYRLPIPDEPSPEGATRQNVNV